MKDQSKTKKELVEEISSLRRKIAELERVDSDGSLAASSQQKSVEGSGANSSASNMIHVSGIDVAWNAEHGTCTFENLPVAMMWVDTTLAGLMSGVQAMVGTERFFLALQSEGRKSVEADWQVISSCPDFREGFKAIANIAAVAGWGYWELMSLDAEQRECRFRIRDSWEGRYQKSLGVCWGSGMLAGKMAGYCTKLFATNCWADQTQFIAKGDNYDEFLVQPSERLIEKEIENLLASDEATRADMAVALRKLEKEISERKRIEMELQKSEQQYRMTIDLLGDAIHVVDRELRIILANKVFAKWAELMPIRADIIGRTVFEAFPFLPKKVREEYDYVIETGRPLETEECNIFNGEVIYTETKKIPIMKGNVVDQIITIVRDISERKRMDNALRDSEERYRSVFENHAAVKFLVDPDTGRIIEANEAAVSYYGWPHERLKQMKIQDINTLSPEDVQKEMEKARTNKRTHFEFRHRLADGSIRDVAVFSSKIGVKGKELLHSIVHDITERKQAEEALRESEEKYQFVVENLKEVVFRTDAEGHWTFLNPAWTEVTGFALEDSLGKVFLEFVYPEDRELNLELFRPLIERKKDYCRHEIRYRNTDGSFRWIEVWARLTLDEKGEATGTAGTLTDITERKRAEEEKRRLEERLQRAEKMEALGTLAGGVAHDLNNVLGIIVGFSELLLNETGESSPIRSRVDNIIKGGERATAIVQDLLTLARRGVPVRQVLNLNKIVADCQQSPEFEKLSSYHPSVRVKADLDPDLLNISGSSVHLGKTLFNLVSNAAESMPNGGPVTIKTVNQYLDKPLHGYDQIREGDYVVLSVSDTGEGIPASDLKRIFEPFYTKKVMGRSGTGLGLAVVWGTVKDHHGYINVESKEGEGSTFTLYFPVTREDITSERVAVPVSEYMGKGESVLIIDDVKGQRELAAAMLEKLNYKVTTVPSGEEAIAYLKERQTDLIVLDMIMDPGMDGLDTYRGILKIHPKQKAIIVSGFSETDRLRAAQRLGAGAYIRKPYVMEKLGMAVRKELSRQ